jgi:hypothetical protein
MSEFAFVLPSSVHVTKHRCIWNCEGVAHKLTHVHTVTQQISAKNLILHHELKSSTNLSNKCTPIYACKLLLVRRFHYVLFLNLAKNEWTVKKIAQTTHFDTKIGLSFHGLNTVYCMSCWILENSLKIDVPEKLPAKWWLIMTELQNDVVKSYWFPPIESYTTSPIFINIFMHKCWIRKVQLALTRQYLAWRLVSNVVETCEPCMHANSGTLPQAIDAGAEDNFLKAVYIVRLYIQLTPSATFLHQLVKAVLHYVKHSLCM